MIDLPPADDIAALTLPLPAEQLALVSLVFNACVEDDGQWPYYGWVESEMDKRGLDPETVFAGFGSLRLGSFRYTAIRSDQLMRVPAANSSVQVTMLGATLLSYERHDLTAAILRPFYDALDCFAFHRRAFTPSRHEVESPTITLPELREWTTNAKSEVEWPIFLAILEAERPIGLTMHRPSSREDDWAAGLERGLLRYERVTTIQDYLTRRAAEAPALVPTFAPVAPSPLSLPVAIDYFNTVWRLAFNESAGPFRFPSGEHSGRLALDVGTAEEFYAAMTAVENVIKTGRLKGVKGDHACVNLRNKLAAELPVELHDEINDAIDTLWAACQVRHTTQHSSVQNTVLEAWRRFGLSPTAGDWPTAWAVIRSHLVTAFDTLRADIETWSGTPAP